MKTETPKSQIANCKSQPFPPSTRLHAHNASLRDTEIVGCLHVHSLYSDGAGSVPDIARSAKRAGLDFVAVNDHEYMTDGLHLDREGMYDGVLVLMGLEIGGRYHHYLAYGLPEMVRGLHLRPQEVIDRVNAAGGFGFLAHPFEKGMPFSEKSVAYTWNDLSVERFRGICIWNFSSRWKERVRTALHALFFLTFKSLALKGPSAETMAFWDRSCLQRRVVAIGGADAHGTPFRWGLLRLTPITYDFALGAITVHLLLRGGVPRDAEGLKQAVYGAMKEGCLYVAHDALAPARGFRFQYVTEQGSRLTMGQEAPFQPGVFTVRVPGNGRVRLIRNGEAVSRRQRREALFRPDGPGVYRVEVRRRAPFFGWRPWIFSNPIYLR